MISAELAGLAFAVDERLAKVMDYGACRLCTHVAVLGQARYCTHPEVAAAGRVVDIRVARAPHGACGSEGRLLDFPGLHA